MQKKKKVSVDGWTPEKNAYLISALKKDGSRLKEKKIFSGFDGFTDSIVKIIKSKEQDKSTCLFTTIKEFGDYILQKQGASLSLEIEEISIKPGGNMPIMSNALGQLGITVNCVGALGHPQIHPVFKSFSTNCHLYSFANPGTATAFEFKDGKIMLAQMGELNITGWEKIKQKIGLDKLKNLYKDSDLICLLNWSEIDASTDIWRGLLKDILPYNSNRTKKRVAFFDLSDCLKRSKESIAEALQIIREFTNYTKVILSLNKNEARIIYDVLNPNNSKKDLLAVGKNLFKSLTISTLVLYSAKEAFAFDGNEEIKIDSFFTDEPKISTGAGDNFNAGFCAGQLLEFDLESSLVLANALSGYYIREGLSPQCADIIHFLKNSSVSK